MDSPNFLFSPTANPIAIQLLHGLYRLNDVLIKNSRLETLLWQWLKAELFYISGACKQSGNCCKNIMLFGKGRPLTQKSDFDDYKKLKPELERFIPILGKTVTHVDGYNCQHLNENNTCNDYENRPQLCRDYPSSFFIKADYLHQGCGYQVKEKSYTFTSKNSRLLSRIHSLKKANKLPSSPQQENQHL